MLAPSVERSSGCEGMWKSTFLRVWDVPRRRVSETCVVKGSSLVTGMMSESRCKGLVRYTLASSNYVG